MRHILGCLRRAVQDFHMIRSGDAIAVGVSGGKDSLVLLQALALYRRFSPEPFTLEAFTLTMGFEPFDTADVAVFCQALEVPYTVRSTQIARVIFEERKEKNPCSLCANMRRGALHDLAIEKGCNKLALGHHRDDAIETFFLSLFYEGRLHTFSPVTWMSRKDITVIRPLLYVPEKQIIGYARKEQLPIIHNPCPANGNTQRQAMKDLIKQLTKTMPKTPEMMLSALRNVEEYGLWDKMTRRPDDPWEPKEIRS